MSADASAARRLAFAGEYQVDVQGGSFSTRALREFAAETPRIRTSAK